MNKIITNGNNVTFERENGHIDVVEKGKYYIHINGDTVNFILIPRTDNGGVAIFSSLMADLTVDGKTYSEEDWKNGTATGDLSTNDGLSYKVVNELPETGDKGVVYLIKAEAEEENNKYVEYIYVDDAYEILGSFSTDINLTQYYTKEESDAKYAAKTEIPSTDNLATKEELALKADKSSMGDYLLKTEAQSTYETKENAAATYQPKGSYLTSIPEEYVTDEELNAKNYATIEQLNSKQDILVSGTNIKTVNGASLLGEGNIQIETPEGGISDAPQDGKTYGRKNAAWSEIVLPDVSDMLTKTEAVSTYQPIGDYVTNDALNGKGYQTSSDVEAKIAAVIDSAPETLDTLNELAAALGDDPNFATTISTQIGQKLDTATYNSEKSTFATKTEIPNISNLATKTELSEGLAGKANTSDLNNYLTTDNAQSTYATKSELGAKLDVETYNSDKATFALKSELPDTSSFITKATADETYQPKGEYLTSIPEEYVTDTELNGKGYATTEQLNAKQDALVSGTNIKTVNGNSLLGEGNIQIETIGGGIADAPSDNKNYGRKNGAWSEITEPDLSNYALKSEVPTQVATTSENGLMSSADKTKLDSIDVTSILSRITALETQMGEVSAKLDTLNGETV